MIHTLVYISGTLPRVPNFSLWNLQKIAFAVNQPLTTLFIGWSSNIHTSRHINLWSWSGDECKKNHPHGIHGVSCALMGKKWGGHGPRKPWNALVYDIIPIYKCVGDGVIPNIYPTPKNPDPRNYGNTSWPSYNDTPKVALKTGWQLDTSNPTSHDSLRGDCNSPVSRDVYSGDMNLANPEMLWANDFLRNRPPVPKKKCGGVFFRKRNIQNPPELATFGLANFV